MATRLCSRLYTETLHRGQCQCLADPSKSQTISKIILSKKSKSQIFHVYRLALSSLHLQGASSRWPSNIAVLQLLDNGDSRRAFRSSVQCTCPKSGLNKGCAHANASCVAQYKVLKHLVNVINCCACCVCYVCGLLFQRLKFTFSTLPSC